MTSQRGGCSTSSCRSLPRPMRLPQLVLLVLLVSAGPIRVAASIRPIGVPPASAGDPAVATAAAAAQAAARVERQNAAIATGAEAAIAASQPTGMLVSFRVPESQVQARSIALSTGASSVGLSAADLKNAARRQVNAAVKGRVLGDAAAAGASRVVEEAGSTAAATSATQQQQPAASGGVRVLADYPHLPITFVSISSPEQLASLRSNPEVLSVVADGVVRPMAMNGLEFIGQPDVLPSYTGTGTVVVLDTGLDYTRKVFGACTSPGVPAATCKVLFTKDMATDDGALDVDDFHGTNVGGIILGVAPGARLIGLDVFDADGTGSFSTLVAAMEWTVANRAAYNITAANLSLGGSKYASACDTLPLAIALNTAFDAGIVSAVAAGNEGYTDSLSVPACASKAVSVGAVFPTDVPGNVGWAMGCNQVSPKRDTVVCFTNSNQQLTILAPGYDIDAADIVLSGTSQATPFVAGALAVMQQRYPGYSPAQLVAQLTSTGVPITDPRNGIVKPRLDLAAAAGVTAAPCTVTASPATIAAPAVGGTVTLQVAASAPGCAWTVSVSAATWLRVAGTTSGTGSAAVALQVDVNAGAARSAVITVSSASGALSVTLQQGAAASTGGTSPPVNSRVMGVPARASVQLTWAPAVDNGSGVSGYKVVYSAGSTAPRPRCSTGTVVPRQASISSNASGITYRVRATGLQPATRYAFRVCAVDAAGNVAVGSVWRGSTRP